MDCIFCKIANKEINSSIVYEDELIVAFKDINPVAPVHVLIIPKEHITGIQSIEESHKELIGHMFLKTKEIAKALNLSDNVSLEGGYRLVFNVGKDAGQTVFHLHLHLIGGRQMSWPPG